MNNNIKKLIIIFSVVCIVFTALFILCLVNYNKTAVESEKTQVNREELPQVNLEYTNDAQKYIRKEIETIDYKMGFKNVYEYNGIYFVSTVEGINDVKLHEMAIELFDNTHGEEMQYVSLVELSPGNGMYCYGRQYDILMQYETPISLYNFFGENSYNIAGQRSHLVVDNVSGDLTAQDMAQALSVAYGHHFVKYYDILTGEEQDYDSQYYKLRGQDNENVRVIIKDNDDYIENGKWYLEHIAAYDYMYLLGSKHANRVLTRHGNDVVWPIISLEQITRYIRVHNRNARNTTPHVNIDLPLPDTVDGLSEYLYSFVDAEPPVYDFEIEPFGEISFENRFIHNHYATNKYFGEREIEFEQIFEDFDIKITVLTYNMDDEFIGVSSISPGTIEKAYIAGVYTFEIGYSTYTYDTREEGEFKIRLLAAYPDGRIIISEPYVFMHP